VLPLDDQILLELFYFEEMQGPDLAIVLSVPEGTVRTRLRRARALLEKAVSELEAAGEGARATTDDIDRWAGSLRDVIRREGLRR
jgi:hypothetical protein